MKPLLGPQSEHLIAYDGQALDGWRRLQTLTTLTQIAKDVEKVPHREDAGFARTLRAKCEVTGYIDVEVKQDILLVLAGIPHLALRRRATPPAVLGIEQRPKLVLA